MIQPNKTIYSGKRKTAVAKLWLKPGDGKIYFNSLISSELGLFHRLALAEPLRIFNQEFGDDLKYDFYIRTSGGGKEGQIQAARLTISRALLGITGSDVLKKAFLKYDKNIIVQDSRRKEPCKPGDSKARARRQKSYR